VRLMQMIEYNGIKFESVKELIEYEEWKMGKPKESQIHKEILREVLNQKNSKYSFWTPKEDSLVALLLSQGKSLEEISHQVGKSEGAVKLRLIRINKQKPSKIIINNKKTSFRTWTPEEIVILKEAVEKNRSTKYISKILKRSCSSVYNKIYEIFDKGKTGYKNKVLKPKPIVQKSNSKGRMKWIHQRTKELLPSFDNQFNYAYMQAIEDYRTHFVKPKIYPEPKLDVAKALGLSEYGFDSLNHIFSDKNKDYQLPYTEAKIALELSDNSQWSFHTWIDFCKKVMEHSKLIQDTLKYSLRVVREQDNYYLVKG
jgi:hypothetical protein